MEEENNNIINNNNNNNNNNSNLNEQIEVKKYNNKYLKFLYFRPYGDYIAKQYGKYLSLNEMKNITVGEEYDILCTDNKNYKIIFKKFDVSTMEGYNNNIIIIVVVLIISIL